MALDLNPAFQQFLQLRQSLAPQLKSFQSFQPATSSYANTGGNVAVNGSLTPAEQWIIQRESGGRTSAKNKTSSAYGLGQLLIGNRQKYASKYGWDPNTNDYGQQLQLFRDYVSSRYGTAENAQKFWQSHGWY